MHSSPKVWYSKQYMQERNGMYTNDELMEKAFKVNDWINMNPDNDWVATVGAKIINDLNALYTKETMH